MLNLLQGKRLTAYSVSAQVKARSATHCVFVFETLTNIWNTLLMKYQKIIDQVKSGNMTRVDLAKFIQVFSK